MTPPLRRAARLLLLPAALALVGPLPPVGAADAPAAPAGKGAGERLAATAKARAALPAPLEPEDDRPGLAFTFDGDLVVAGDNAGSVSIHVDVGTFRDQPVWLVTETVAEDWAGTRQTTEASYWLTRDLSLVRGEWQRTSPHRFTRLEFKREGEGFAVTREDGDPEKGMPPTESRSLPAPAGATFGRGALLLFLRYGPKDLATYEFPLVPLETLMPTIDDHPVPIDPAPLALELRGPAKWGEKPDVVDSTLAVTRHGGRLVELHLDPSTRGLVALEQRRPTGISIVPKGKGGARVSHDDDQPALSWKACFLKFGHGYHMAVERWIDGAIDWEALLAHDVKVGAVSKDWTTADLRRAYVGEFIKQSKRRPRAEADALLRMTLATGKLETRADGVVVLSTHPEFGGNTFEFRPNKDGVWHIVRIDQ